eukprot:768649-Hanusia_phi.AAC.2
MKNVELSSEERAHQGVPDSSSSRHFPSLPLQNSKDPHPRADRQASPPLPSVSLPVQAEGSSMRHPTRPSGSFVGSPRQFTTTDLRPILHASPCDKPDAIARSSSSSSSHRIPGAARELAGRAREQRGQEGERRSMVKDTASSKQEEGTGSRSFVARNLFSSFLHDSLLDSSSADLKLTPVASRHRDAPFSSSATPRGPAGGEPRKEEQLDVVVGTLHLKERRDSMREGRKEEAYRQPWGGDNRGGSGRLVEQMAGAVAPAEGRVGSREGESRERTGSMSDGQRRGPFYDGKRFLEKYESK